MAGYTKEVRRHASGATEHDLRILCFKSCYEALFKHPTLPSCRVQVGITQGTLLTRAHDAVGVAMELEAAVHSRDVKLLRAALRGWESHVKPGGKAMSSQVGKPCQFMEWNNKAADNILWNGIIKQLTTTVGRYK